MRDSKQLRVEDKAGGERRESDKKRCGPTGPPSFVPPPSLLLLLVLLLLLILLLPPPSYLSNSYVPLEGGDCALDNVLAAQPTSVGAVLWKAVKEGGK